MFFLLLFRRVSRNNFRKSGGYPYSTMTVSTVWGQCWFLIALQYISVSARSVATADLIQVCGWAAVGNTFFNGITGNHMVRTQVVWLEEQKFFRQCFFKLQFKLMTILCIIWMQLVNFVEFLHWYLGFMLQDNIVFCCQITSSMC